MQASNTEGATDGNRGDVGGVDVGCAGPAAACGGGVRAAAGGEAWWLRPEWSGLRIVPRGWVEAQKAEISQQVEAAFADPVAARSARMMAAGLTFEWVQWRVKVLSRWQLVLALSSLPLVLLGIWVGGAAGQLMAATGLLISGIAAGLNFGLQSLREVVQRHDDTAEFLHECLGKRRTP